MKLKDLCLIVLAITASVPTHSLRAMSPCKLGIIVASGALISGATAAWAHRKVRHLESLSDVEKNKPETKKSLVQWKTVKRACSILSFLSGISSAVLLYNMRQQNIRRQNRERLREEIRRSEEEINSINEELRVRNEEGNRLREQSSRLDEELRRLRANNQPEISPEAQRRAREKLEQQNRMIRQREKERAQTTAQSRNIEQIQTQEAVINSIKPLLMQAAQSGNLAEIENLIDQCPGEAKENLLNARDAQGNTAWYYAAQNADEEVLTYALEKAAEMAKNECGICGDTINDIENYALGSQSFNCLHFYCLPCRERTQAGYTQETEFEGQTLVGDKVRPLAGKCPTCKRT